MSSPNSLPFVSLPRRKRRRGGVTITMPRGFLPDEERQRKIVWATATSLQLSNYRVEPRLDGHNRHLHIRSKERSVPELVPFNDAFKALLEAAPPHRKLIGYTTADRPFYLDFLSENPHVLLSCATGWGKTTAVGIMLADELHKGGEGVCLDIKYGSMRWAYGLPGVTYARTVEAIHDTLILIGRELLRRREVLGNTPYTRHPVFPRMFIVIEEMNALQEELRDYWTERRAELRAEAKQAGVVYQPPTKSPAIKAYKQVGLMGRQLGMNKVVITQRGEAGAVGGSGAREQLGTIILGWPTKKTWDMLAPQHRYVPHDNRPGHAHISRGKHLHEVQFVLSTEPQLREWATSGKTPAATLSKLSQGNEMSAGLGNQATHVLGQPRLRLVDGGQGDPVEAPGVTLREASSDDGGLVPENLGQLRKQSTRDPGFPGPLLDKDGEPLKDANGAHYYDPEAVIAWSRNRRRRGLGRANRQAQP